MPLISFDIDGVMCEFTRGFTRLANDLFGTPVADALSHRQWVFDASPELGLTKEMVDEVWKHIDQSSSFWLMLDPINISVLRRIDSLKERMFLTNRRNAEEQTCRWLEIWGIKNPRVVTTDSRKGRIAKELGVAAHLDDRVLNCDNLVKHLPDAFISLLRAPLNYDHTWFGHVSLSIDHFLDECESRGLIS